jgi:hypothetical protein
MLAATGGKCRVAENRNQFHQTTKSGFMCEADKWTLITDTVSGAQIIEHEWSYIDPFGHGKLDRGVSIATVENFLTGKADDSVKQKLRDVLLNTSALK